MSISANVLMFSVKLKELCFFFKKNKKPKNQTTKPKQKKSWIYIYIKKELWFVCCFWAILSSHGVDTDDGAR